MFGAASFSSFQPHHKEQEEIPGFKLLRCYAGESRGIRMLRQRLGRYGIEPLGEETRIPRAVGPGQGLNPILKPGEADLGFGTPLACNRFL